MNNKKIKAIELAEKILVSTFDANKCEDSVFTREELKEDYAFQIETGDNSCLVEWLQFICKNDLANEVLNF